MKHVNNKGFSLIELMIVVAIIGILATVAIPNFQRFQGKAKQSEAKSQLGGVYMAQKAFFAEYSFYGGEFGIIGFVPQGNAIVYRISTGENAAMTATAGVITNTNLPSTMRVAACIVTTGGQCTAAAYGGTLPVWGENSATAASGGAGTTSNTAFFATAGATLNPGAATIDTWTMTDLNVLVNTVYGI